MYEAPRTATLIEGETRKPLYPVAIVTIDSAGVLMLSENQGWKPTDRRQWNGEAHLMSRNKPLRLVKLNDGHADFTL